MKKFLMAGTALAALIGTPALAADVALKAPPPPAAPAWSWTGYYIGATVGVGVNSDPTTWNWANTYPTGTLIGVGGGPLVALTAPLTVNTSFAHRQSSVGVVGGVEAGANWQTGKWVYGVEADWSATSQRSTSSAQPVTAQFPPYPLFFFAPGTVQGWTKSIDWLSTIRVRDGIADGPNLWFVTGGLAVAQIETSLFSSPGSPGAAATGNGAQFGLPGGVVNDHQTKVGWTLGGGVETAISRLLGWGPGWSAKIEYLYADLGKVHINTSQVPLPTNTAAGPFVTGSTSFSSSTQEHIMRVGLNYRFGAAPGAQNVEK
jgi:outer membrane immunogenic protein